MFNSLENVFKCSTNATFTLLKHPGQRDPEKGPLGPNSIPGQRWPGNQSTWREIWPRAGSTWPHYLSFWLISGSSLTRNGVWPQWTLFRVTADPGVFRVHTLSLEKVPTVGGGYPPPTPSPRSVASLPRRGHQTNVPPSRFCPSKTQSIPARLPLATPVVTHCTAQKVTIRVNLPKDRPIRKGRETAGSGLRALKVRLKMLCSSYTLALSTFVNPPQTIPILNILY